MAPKQVTPITNQRNVPPTLAGTPGATSVPIQLFGQHPNEDRAVMVFNNGTTVVYYGHREDMTQLTGVPIFPGGAVVVPTTEPVYVINSAGTATTGSIAYAQAPKGFQYSPPGTGTANSAVAQGAAGATPWPVSVSNAPTVAQGTPAAVGNAWPVYIAPGPGPVQASATAAAAAANAASLPAVAGKTNYLEGFVVSSAPPAATVSGLVTVTGCAGGTLNFYFTETATLGGLLNVQFPNPIPAAAVNSAITVNVPAIAGGATTAVVITGNVQ